MTGAICGGAPFVYKTERDETPRWCFGERRRQPGAWELRGDTPTQAEPSWYEDVWIYRCDGCGKDRRDFPGWS